MSQFYRDHRQVHKTMSWSKQRYKSNMESINKGCPKLKKKTCQLWGS